MWGLYEREHGDKTRRFPIFKNNARWILHKTRRNKGKSAAINIFGDRTYDEVLTLATGLREIDMHAGDNFSSVTMQSNFSMN